MCSVGRAFRFVMKSTHGVHMKIGLKQVAVLLTVTVSICANFSLNFC